MRAARLVVDDAHLAEKSAEGEELVGLGAGRIGQVVGERCVLGELEEALRERFGLGRRQQRRVMIFDQFASGAGRQTDQRETAGHADEDGQRGQAVLGGADAQVGRGDQLGQFHAAA